MRVYSAPGIINTSAVITGPRPWIDVTAYGAKGNGVTDDTVAIQAAIDAIPDSGGVLYFPAATYIVNGTVSIPDGEGVLLKGDPAQITPYAAYTNGTVWKRLSGTGIMLDWEAVSSSTSLRGNGIENILFDGNNLATTVVKLVSHYGGTWKNIHIQNGTSVGLALTTVNLTGVEDFQKNLFQNLSIVCTATAAAKGMTLSSFAVGGGNVSLNVFENIIVNTQNGTGIECGDSDTNTFLNVECNRNGSAIGIDLLGSTTASGGACRHNVFLHVDAVGGITTRATSYTANPANSNYVLLSKGNSTPLPTIEAGSTLYVQDTRGRSLGIMPQYRTETIVKDDFYVGSTAAGTGVVGELGGSVTNGSFSYLAPVAGHPGIIRLDTGAVSGTVCAWTPNNNGGSAFFANELFDQTWVVRLNQNDTDTQVRLGVQGSGTGDTSSNGIYFEKTFANTASWGGIGQAGGARGTSANAGAISTNWVTLRVRQQAVGIIAFSVDGATEAVQTSNVPGAVQIQPFLQIKNQVNSSKTIDIDLYEARLSGLSRT